MQTPAALSTSCLMPLRIPSVMALHIVSQLAEFHVYHLTLIGVSVAGAVDAEMLQPARADALMNCVVHMHDPEGSLRCSGVSGGYTDDQVRCVCMCACVHVCVCACVFRA